MTGPPLAAALAALFLLAGCFGGCGPMGDASWTEPGLYAALPAGAARAGLDVREDPARPTLPAPEGVLPAGVGVTSVQSEPTRERDGLGLDATEDGPRLRALLAHAAPDDEVRAVVVAFLREVTSADEAKLATWADEAVLSRNVCAWGGGGGSEPQPHRDCFAAAVAEADVDLTRLFQGPFEGRLDLESFSPGHAAAEAGGWRVVVAAPTRSVDVPLEGDARIGLTVGALDHVRATTALPTTDSENLTRERVQEAFGKMGLPPPTFEDWGHGVMVC